MGSANSLLEPNGSAVLPAAIDWVTATLFGELATGLCLIAIAFIGLLLMTGRVAIREGARVAVGCFVLLGAPIIAGGLQGIASDTVSQDTSEPVFATPQDPPAPLPPANYDPYAGASLLQN